MRNSPEHPKGYCQVLKRDGNLCQKVATVKMVREDQSTLPMCKRHSDQLRKVHADHPGSFAAVTWQVVH